jgi:hypothetical protein
MSPTVTTSGSMTPSLTRTRTSSPTPSQTQTDSPTRPTTTASISVTPSFRPFSLEMVAPSSAPATASGALLLSDSIPTVALALWLDRCPHASDLSALSTTCEVSVATSTTSGIASAPYAGLPLQASQNLNLQSCDASSGAALLPVSLVVGAFFGTGSGTGTLTCEVRSSNGVSVNGTSTSASLAHASLPISTQATLWPLLADVVISLRSGLLRSSRLGSVNASRELIRACEALGSGSTCSSEAASVDPWQLMTAAVAVWGRTPLPQSAPSQPFSLTLSGPTLLVLRARRWAFDGLTAASMGGVSCSVLATSTDGLWAVVRSPNASDVPDGAGGYLPLVLQNPATYAGNETGSSIDGGSPNATARGCALSCPPFCPGLDGALAFAFWVVLCLSNILALFSTFHVQSRLRRFRWTLAACILLSRLQFFTHHHQRGELLQLESSDHRQLLLSDSSTRSSVQQRACIPTHLQELALTLQIQLPSSVLLVLAHRAGKSA